MKKPNAKRARVERRRRARKAKHEARAGGSPPHSPAYRRHGIIPTQGEPPPGGLYDDCPACRALAAIGAKPNAQGSLELTREQQQAYERELAEILEREGAPPGFRAYSEDELRAAFKDTQQKLIDRGFRPDVENMDDDEFDAFLKALFEIGGPIAELMAGFAFPPAEVLN